MVLQVYVDRGQIGAFGSPPLQLGLEISFTLVGNFGSTVGPTVRALDCYLADTGKKSLRRVGFIDYAFCGQILEIRERTRGQLEYQEALVDCGVPVILAAFGPPGIEAHDLNNPTNKELTRGRYLSGLMLLYAHIVQGFRDPPLIKRELVGRIISIETIDLLPESVNLAGLRTEEVIHSDAAVLPAILGIEIK